MNEEILIRKYQILQFLRQMPTAVVGPTYAVFLLGKGLSLAELSLVAISFFVVLLIVELPTGIFADRFGRKKSMLVSCFVAGFAPIVYIFANNLWGCMLAEAIYAISCGFYNGTLDAWIKHELQCVGKDTTHLHKASAQGLQAMQVSLASGALLGGWLASINMVWPWVVGVAVSFVLPVAVALLMKENYRGVKEKADLWEGIKTVKQDNALKLVCGLGFLGSLATAPFNMYWQPFFSAHILDIKILGILSFLFYTINFAGAKIAEKVLSGGKSGNQRRGMVLSQVFIGIAVILCVATPLFPISVSFFILHEGGRGVFFVMRQTYLQFSIKKESQRAFIGSISSFFEQAGSIVAYLGCFILLSHLSIGSIWIISSLVVIAASLALCYYFRPQPGKPK